MFEIEFSTGRQLEERKTALYKKKSSVLSSRSFQIISLSAVCAFFMIALFLGIDISRLQTPLPLHEKILMHLRLMLFFGGLCFIVFLLLVNFIRPLQIHFPGTKLDYDGHYPAETFHLSFGTGHFTVTRNSERTDFKYTDIHRVFKDRRGLLLADIDLYIPLEILTQSERKLLIRRFTRPRRKQYRRGSGT
ncbi:hypothetical protein HNP82_001859 [Catenibacillus scindens]|uniref:YcxB-like protein domain-containing protein n=1 Tax=Catenibacillus scindens TaxID=673271 RepID=A0A7W8M5U3_9FIRM|nr:hypothetical protein [Catenibacillus scindens]MBB5264731.1 hypothetical protein [Catenibacillus scindens]